MSSEEKTKCRKARAVYCDTMYLTLQKCKAVCPSFAFPILSNWRWEKFKCPSFFGNYFVKLQQPGVLNIINKYR